MSDATAVLARSITRASSKQAYYTARLLVDDFYRAYAYFRWADDIIDVSSQSNDYRISFIKRQRVLIDCLYRNERLDDLTPEEEIIAAHITHLLRDMLLDTSDGFINIPREYLETHGISPESVDIPPLRAWVQNRVEQARQYFREGKRYLDALDVLRCRIAGYWYCARFEGILNTIERDGYILRTEYNERHNFSTLFRIAWLGASVTVRHIVVRRGFRDS
jgi:phytoene/squalene synthetase